MERQIEIFNTYLQERQMVFDLCHDYHEKYFDIKLSPAILGSISSRQKILPGKIYPKLQPSEFCDFDKVAQYQVYYQWQQNNSLTWRRHTDLFIAARKPLQSERALKLYVHR